ncbi:MAG: DUF4373 domain-containing protein [Erysipelotrichia bacterium]|nr:DUF4373 domain-containing protein [Erysipelotrichia bacterium]
MARPIKESLSYFPLDSDFFSDRKIRRLLKTFGGKGVTIYIYVLCEVYRQSGYFLQYDRFYIQDISDALGEGFNKNLVSDVINFALNTGLFDKKVFDSNCVLTSAGIQKRYLSAKESSAKRTFSVSEIFPQYCCIDETEQPEDSAEFYGELRSNTPLNGEELGNIPLSGVSPLKEKEIKEKKSKEKENNVFDVQSFGVEPVKIPDAFELPENLKTSSFTTAWAEWLEYKKQRKESYKPIGVKQLLKKLADFGPEEAVRKLETAMSNNWAGCVFDNRPSKKNGRGDTGSAISSLSERLKRIEANA